jgi:hypothetical protein
VGGLPGHLDLEPCEPPVSDRDLHLRGLGHHSRFRGRTAERAQHLLDADARVLLVCHGRDHDISGQLARSGLAAGDQRGGHARLHVIGATAVEAVTVHARRVPIGHALHPDGVEMPAEQKCAPAPAAAGAHDDARAARCLLVHLGLETGALGPARHVRGDLGLAGGARLERGIDGVDRDERAGQLDDVGGAHCGPTLTRS